MTAKIRVFNEGDQPLLYGANRLLMPGKSSTHDVSDLGSSISFTPVSVGDDVPAPAPAPSTDATVRPTPASIGMFQTELSRKLLGSDVWLYCTTRAAMAPTNDIKVRIMLNCGCDADGNWRDTNGNPLPAFSRGFETADTAAEQERLRRFNATPSVFDITVVNGHPELDLFHHVAMVTGMYPKGRDPIFYAVRAEDEAALDEWCEFMAASRGNPGA